MSHTGLELGIKQAVVKKNQFSSIFYEISKFELLAVNYRFKCLFINFRILRSFFKLDNILFELINELIKLF